MPTALSGIISGILLALARVMGETAPVLVLVGYAQVDQLRPVRRATWRSLPLLIYDRLINPRSQAGRLRVWGAALTLILLVAVLYIAAAFVAKFFARNRA